MGNSVQDFPLILLCGGKSSRMGQPKGLIDAKGKPFLERQLDRFRDAGGKRVVVVLGYDMQPYVQALSWLSAAPGIWTERDGLFRSVVVNTLPQYGPFSSITSGAEIVLARKDRGAFILPVDVPAADKDVWEKLVNSFSGPVQACLPVFKGRGGHPVLLARTFLLALLHIPVDSPEARLDRQLRTIDQDQVARVFVNDERILKNMNTPGDLETVLGKKWL
ncbi:MAG: nucleotidyltransferase family protein [Pseudomonadota bacterium]